MSNSWIWTDELVLELLEKMTSMEGHENRWRAIERFKASKQPKPEWEILEYKHGGITDLPPAIVGQKSIWWNQAVCNNWPIHSVKRLSDGEVFSVGDKFWIKQQAGEYWVIYKIEIGIEGDIRFISPSGYNWGLKLALKHPIHQSTMPVYLTPSQLEKLLTLLKE